MRVAADKGRDAPIAGKLDDCTSPKPIILGMTSKALLSNDWGSIAGRTRNLSEDVVPNVGFVALVSSSTCSVDRDSTKVVWCESLNDKRATE